MALGRKPEVGKDHQLRGNFLRVELREQVRMRGYWLPIEAYNFDRDRDKDIDRDRCCD